jgi:hypothetical protein
VGKIKNKPELLVTINWLNQGLQGFLSQLWCFVFNFFSNFHFSFCFEMEPTLFPHMSEDCNQGDEETRSHKKCTPTHGVLLSFVLQAQNVLLFFLRKEIKRRFSLLIFATVSSASSSSTQSHLLIASIGVFSFSKKEQNQVCVMIFAGQMQRSVALFSTHVQRCSISNQKLHPFCITSHCTQQHRVHSLWQKKKKKSLTTTKKKKKIEQTFLQGW